MIWTTQRFLKEYEAFLQERKKDNPRGVYFISPQNDQDSK